jgi:HAE1 family hydrophobic/amphiphilic exporter-1
MQNPFIRKPVLSGVLAILISLVGLLALQVLPMTQFPSIAPPEVNVTVEYTGANAETVTKSALVPIERAINGVPGMKYMSSDAGNDGVGVVQVLFETGVDPDIASMNVQNRVAAVMGELPSEVIRNGVKIAKEENAMLMYINVYSTDTALEEKFLYNFTDIKVLAEIKRIKGVGYADILGAREYAMRIWLKPDKMIAYQISPAEVEEALQAYNVEAAPGKVGESTDKKAQELQYVVRYPGRFQKPEEYKRIPVKAGPDGRILRIEDLADVEFGTVYFDVETRLNGKPAAAIMVKQLPGSNASEVIESLKQKLEQLKAKQFLKGMDFEISYDVSRFLDASIHEVLITLLEAFVLVAFVVFLFLQDARATLIPVLTVPVSLIGTFLFMQWFGFSLNLITLFALVLAIGIVIDNAIVVVEAVHSRLTWGKSALLATEEAMKDISGAIVAITLIMAAVFVPASFLDGPTGVFFRQFSLTMAVAIVLSGVMALTFTPALCVILLKPHTRLGPFFQWFNTKYERFEGRVVRINQWVMHRRLLVFLALLLVFAANFGLMRLIPSGFIPAEDQGSFYVSVTTPAGATLERTKKVVNAVREHCQKLPEVESVSTLSGTNILSDGTGATYGTCLVNLKPWSERKRSVGAIMEEVESRIASIQDARMEVFPPPPVPGYGNAGGFELRLLDKTGRGDAREMQETVDRFIADLKALPEVGSAFTIYDARFPQYMVQIDADKAAQKQVTTSEAMATLQTLLGSSYASNFIRFGQMYKVMVQALPEYRAKPEDLLAVQIKNKEGEMVPLSAFARLERVFGVDQVTRYNMYPSAELNGEPAPGVSSGTVLESIRKTAEAKLPQGYDIDWAGISRDEVQQGNQPIYIFLLSLLFVYLLLAARYESFLLPFPVLLSLPVCTLGTWVFLYFGGLENNIYAQIALVMLIGLIGKNGILVVEFALAREREGDAPFEAALEGTRARLRPIIMTSFACIAGLLPLLFARGAGATGNQTIGAAATGGMLFGTILGIFIVPALYVVARKLSIRSTKTTPK